MHILLACGQDGLLECRGSWRQVSCPLASPTQLAFRGGRVLAADDAQHLLWNGRAVWPIDSGVEALAWWRGRALVLSGDTDSLTLLDPDTGQPQMLTPAGMYPQDLCFVSGDLAAVCGGADGLLRLIRMSDLRTVREIPLPGIPQRVAFASGVLTVLCLTGDAALNTLMVRVPLGGGPAQRVCVMPGLPGALCPDGRGGIWMAVTERVAHFPPQSCAPDLCLSDFGLVRHMERLGDRVLTSDPVLGQCVLVGPGGQRQTLLEGDVQQAIWAE